MWLFNNIKLRARCVARLCAGARHLPRGKPSNTENEIQDKMIDRIEGEQNFIDFAEKLMHRENQRVDSESMGGLKKDCLVDLNFKRYFFLNV